ncbi:MAG: hypothetical protein HOP91_05305 [Sphingomonas sp.]|nr:hypothetical protein [Sphingomonas sp.]
MDGIKVTSGDMFAALAEQLRANAVAALAAVIILVGGNLALDTYSSSPFGPAGFLSLAMQLFLTRAALQQAGVIGPKAPAKFLSFWGMTIVSSIAIVLGCILLLLPGIYLAARWMIAGPAIIGEDLSAGAGMRQSWERTRESVWSIAGALVLVVGGGFVAATIPISVYGEGQAPLIVTAIAYLFAFTGSVCGWLMAVGAYEMLGGPRQEELAEVFA